jgi:hypothetical protein
MATALAVGRQNRPVSLLGTVERDRLRAIATTEDVARFLSSHDLYP